jgi:UDP-N-acetylglucosamine 4-epimerase
MLKGEIIFINGDGETSRDFSYVANVIQANLLSAATSNPNALNQVYNIAIGSRTTLNQLFEIIQDGLMTEGALVRASSASYRNFRAGDIQHSLADVSKAKELLGYSPTHDVRQGLGLALRWYIDRLATESGTRRSLTQETVIGAIPAR